jgi:hypothetical protein
MNGPHPPLKLGLLPLVVFLVFGLGAALLVPSDYGADPRPTPPDEGAHLGYIIYLAEHLSLPVFRSQTDNYEAHQPPLYYASAVLPYMLCAFEDQHSLVVGVRQWSVLVACLGIWAAWLLGRRIFGHDRLLALAPALFLALWPGRTLILAAVTNDGLAEGLCLLTFALCVAALQEGLTARRAAQIGLAWSLALLTKSTSMSLGPVVLLTLAMAGSSHSDDIAEARSRRSEALRALLIIGGIVLLLAGWWFVRNQLLYGDPLAAKAFAALFKADRATPEYFLKLGMSGGAYFLLVVMNTALSFWGVYGQANVWSPEWYYLLGGLIWLLTLVGLLRQRFAPVGEAEDDAPWRRQVFILAWLLLAVVVVFFLRFNTDFYQAQARYLFAANGPIAVLTILGLWDVDRRKLGRAAVVLALALMLIMSVWSVFGYGALAAAHYPPPFIGGM